MALASASSAQTACAASAAGRKTPPRAATTFQNRPTKSGRTQPLRARRRTPRPRPGPRSPRAHPGSTPSDGCATTEAASAWWEPAATKSTAAKALYVTPGADSEEPLARAEALGLAPIFACSIVDIGERP